MDTAEKTDRDRAADADAAGEALAHELRQLRYADPPPGLRRRALAGVAEQLAAPPRFRLAGFWPELALAAAALLIFSLSGASFVPGPDAKPAPPPIGIASQLGLGPKLGGYLEQRQAAATGPERPSRFASLS